MNEELLQAIYDNEGFAEKGITFDEFKEDIKQPELQKAVFDNAKFSDKGVSFEEFQNDLNVPVDGVEAEPKRDLGALNNTVVGNLVNDGLDILEASGSAIGVGGLQGASVSEGINALIEGGKLSDEEIEKIIGQTKRLEEAREDSATGKFVAEGDIESGKFLITLAAETFLESGTALLRSAVDSFTEWETGLVQGGALAATALTGGKAAPAALGINSAMLEASGKFIEEMQKELVDKGLEFNVEGFRAVLEDEEALARIRKKASIKGGVVGAVDMATGALAYRLGVKAAKKVARLANKSARRKAIAAAGLKGFAVEGAGGFIGEEASVLATGEEITPEAFREGLLEIIGEGPSAIITTGLGVYKGKLDTPAEKVNDVEDTQPGQLVDDINTNNVENYQSRLSDLAVKGETAETLTAKLDAHVSAGTMTEEQASQILQDFPAYQQANSTIPAEFDSDLKRSAVVDRIVKRNALEDQKQVEVSKEVDPSFQEEKDAKVAELDKMIESIDQQITAIKKDDIDITQLKKERDAKKAGPLREEGVKEEGKESGIPNLQEQPKEEKSQEVVSDEEFDNFVDTGEVVPDRITDIANKVAEGKPLSEREQAMFEDKTGEVNEALVAKKNVEIEEQNAILEDQKVEPVYEADFVDNPEALENMFPPLTSQHTKPFYDHLTVAFKPEKLKGLVGEKGVLRAVGRFVNDKVDALIIEGSDSVNENPHITLNTAKDVKPFQVNEEIANNPDKIQKFSEPLEIPVTRGFFDGKKQVTEVKEPVPFEQLSLNQQRTTIEAQIAEKGNELYEAFDKAMQKVVSDLPYNKQERFNTEVNKNKWVQALEDINIDPPSEAAKNMEKLLKTPLRPPKAVLNALEEGLGTTVRDFLDQVRPLVQTRGTVVTTLNKTLQEAKRAKKQRRDAKKRMETSAEDLGVSKETLNEINDLLNLDDTPTTEEGGEGPVDVQFRRGDTRVNREATETLINDINNLDDSNLHLDIRKSVRGFGNMLMNTVFGRKGLVKTPKVIKAEDYQGIPMMVTISDELTSGEITNPATGETIDNLKGGILYPYTKGNTKQAWAYTNIGAATPTLNTAKNIYVSNKKLFDNLWAKGKLPKNQVPVLVVKMGVGAMESNEAVTRQLVQNLHTFPAENKRKAMGPLKADIQQKGIIAKNTLDVKSTPSNRVADKAYRDITDFLNRPDINTIDDVANNLTDLSISTRPFLTKALTIGEAGKVPQRMTRGFDTPAVNALMDGIETQEGSKLHLGHLVNNLKDPVLANVPDKHVMGLIGIDITQDKPRQSDGHPNYPFTLNGSGIGIFQNTFHLAEAIPAAYGNMIKKSINAKKEISPDTAISRAIPPAMNNKIFRNVPLNARQDAVVDLVSFLQLAFPNAQFFMDQNSWNDVLSTPGVKQYVKKGDNIYGLTTQGNVYLNPAFPDFNTPIHEAGHLWVDHLEATNGELFNQGIKLVEGTQEFEIAKAELGDNINARKEALAQLIGNKGETIVDGARKSKFKNWLGALWKYIKNNFKDLKGLTPNEISNLTLDEFLEGALNEILGAETVTEKGVTHNNVFFSKEPGSNLDTKIRNILDKINDPKGKKVASRRFVIDAFKSVGLNVNNRRISDAIAGKKEARIPVAAKPAPKNYKDAAQIDDPNMGPDGEVLFTTEDVNNLRAKFDLPSTKLEETVKNFDSLFRNAAQFMSTPKENMSREALVVAEILRTDSAVSNLDEKMVAIRRAIDILDTRLDTLIADSKKPFANKRMYEQQINELVEEIHYYTKAYNKIGTLGGRILRFRQKDLKAKFYSKDHLRKLYKEAKGGKKLTETEEAFIKRISESYNKVSNELDALTNEKIGKDREATRNAAKTAHRAMVTDRKKSKKPKKGRLSFEDQFKKLTNTLKQDCK